MKVRVSRVCVLIRQDFGGHRRFLIKLPRCDTRNWKSLMATQWRLSICCVIICGWIFDRFAWDTKILTRRMRPPTELRGKVAGLCRLVDRMWENLAWLQVQRHGIDMRFTLMGHDKCERSNTGERTLLCRD